MLEFSDEVGDIDASSVSVLENTVNDDFKEVDEMSGASVLLPNLLTVEVVENI